MLTIKHQFINKVALSRMLYEVRAFFGRMGTAIGTGFASLRERSRSMGRKSILSSLVLLVGFFGSLSALLMLYPLTTDRGSTQPANPTNANLETETKAARPSNGNGNTSNSSTGDASSKNPVQGSTTPLATSPVTPSPSGASAPIVSQPEPVVTPTPLVSQPTVTTQPTITSSPSTPAPAPTPMPVLAPVTSPAEPTAPESAPLLPMLTPVTNTVEGTTEAVQDTAGSLLD